MARTKRRIDQFVLMMICRCKLQVGRLCHRQEGDARGARKAIFVHIGTHKTGTTSIQYFLRRQARQLKRSGILVPRSGTLSLTTGHHNIPWDILSFPLREPHAGGLDDLIIELKAAQESVAVISSEAFEYLVQDPEKLRQFHERLVGIGYDPTYLVFFRNKSDYVRSLYYELMKHNVDKSIEWFEAEIKAKGSITVHGGWHHEFDYDRFVAKWKSAVGDAIVAFNYDEVSKHPGLIPFFFEKIGAPAEIVTASANLPLLNRSEAASARTGSREE